MIRKYFGIQEEEEILCEVHINSELEVEFSIVNEL